MVLQHTLQELTAHTHNLLGEGNIASTRHEDSCDKLRACTGMSSVDSDEVITRGTEYIVPLVMTSSIDDIPLQALSLLQWFWSLVHA